MRQYINKNNLFCLAIYLFCLIISFSIEEYIYISESVLNNNIDLLVNKQFEISYLFSGDVFSSSLITNSLISLFSFSNNFYILIKIFNIFISTCFVAIIIYSLRENYITGCNKIISLIITLFLSTALIFISSYSFISFKISMLLFSLFLFFWKKADTTREIKYYIICGILSLFSFSFVLYLSFIIFETIKYFQNKEKSKIKFIIIVSSYAIFIIFSFVFLQVFNSFNIKGFIEFFEELVPDLSLIMGNSIILNLSIRTNAFMFLIAIFTSVIYYILVLLTFRDNKNKISFSLFSLGIIILIILLFDLNITYSFGYLFFFNCLYVFPQLIVYINENGKKYRNVLLTATLLILGIGLLENNYYKLDKDDYLITAYYDSDYLDNMYDFEEVFGCDKSSFVKSLKELSLNEKLEKYELAVDKNNVTIDKLDFIYGDISFEDDGNYLRLKKDVAFLTYCAEDYLYLNIYVPSKNLNNEYVIYINEDEVYKDNVTHSANNVLLDTSKFKGQQVYIKIKFKEVNFKDNFEGLCFQISRYDFLDMSLSTNESLVDLTTIRKIYGFNDNGDGSSWLGIKNLFELHINSNQLEMGLFFTENATPNRMTVKINNKVIGELIIESVGTQFLTLTVDVSEYNGQNVVVELAFDKDFYPPDYGVEDYRELTAIISFLNQYN